MHVQFSFSIFHAYTLGDKQQMRRKGFSMRIGFDVCKAAGEKA